MSKFGFMLNEDDFQLYWNTYSWPQRVYSLLQVGCGIQDILEGWRMMEGKGQKSAHGFQVGQEEWWSWSLLSERGHVCEKGSISDRDNAMCEHLDHPSIRGMWQMPL